MLKGSTVKTGILPGLEPVSGNDVQEREMTAKKP
jgi:hypothetical protein